MLSNLQICEPSRDNGEKRSCLRAESKGPDRESGAAGWYVLTRTKDIRACCSAQGYWWNSKRGILCEAFCDRAGEPNIMSAWTFKCWNESMSGMDDEREQRSNGAIDLNKTFKSTEAAHMMNDLTHTKIMTGSARGSGKSRFIFICAWKAYININLSLALFFVEFGREECLFSY